MARLNLPKWSNFAWAARTHEGAAARRGFALRDALDASQPHNSTRLGAALEGITEKYDRFIVITDEQAHDRVPAPKGRGMRSTWRATKTAWATASGCTSTVGARRWSSTFARWRLSR
jgi:hypothetical protein